MSLDVYLTAKNVERTQRIEGPRIFIREDGATKEISREEWDRRHPGREPCVVDAPARDEEVFSNNITHNLNRMAEDAGIYKHLWRPDEIGVTVAGQLIEPLENGLALLRSDPARFELLNPPNGWGDYEGLCAFVEDYLAACKKHPNAEVSVWR